MAIITIFSGSFCDEEPVIQEVISRTGYTLITDNEVVAAASRHSGMDESKIKRAFSARTSVFNKFTHEKERSIAFLKLAVTDLIPDDNILVTCFSGQLIPKSRSQGSVARLLLSRYRSSCSSFTLGHLFEFSAR